jgi:hypothetical protein
VPLRAWRFESSQPHSKRRPPGGAGSRWVSPRASPSLRRYARPPPDCGRRACIADERWLRTVPGERRGLGPDRRRWRADGRRPGPLLARGERAVALAERRRRQAGVDDPLAGDDTPDGGRQLGGGRVLQEEARCATLHRPPQVARSPERGQDQYPAVRQLLSEGVGSVEAGASRNSKVRVSDQPEGQIEPAKLTSGQEPGPRVSLLTEAVA